MKRWKTFATAAFAAAALFAAITLWSLLRPGPVMPVRRYALGLDSTEALGSTLGRVAFSPNGDKIVYTTLPGPKLIVRSRDQLHGAILPTADQSYSPFFSADGARVGYVGPPSNLSVVSLNGGPAVKISDSIAAGGAAFGPDGLIYAASNLDHGLIRLAETPGAPNKRVTTVDSAGGETAHGWPDVLPNGKGVLFTIRYQGGINVAKAPAIAVVDLATGKHHVLVTGIRAKYSPTGHLLYGTSDGTLMMVPFDQSSLTIKGDPVAIAQGLRVGGLGAMDFGVARDGTLFYVIGGSGIDRELVWVNRDGKTEPVDPGWHGGFADPAISPDGKRLAVDISSGTTGDTHIWVKQLDRGPALRLTFDAPINVYPSWTPDGASITYESSPYGRQVLMSKRADGSAQAVVQYKGPRDLAEAVWSKDGKWLAVRTSASVSGGGDILAMRPGVDSIATPLVATPFVERNPTLSPDGRWMAYTSNETGATEVYVVPFPNAASAKWPISTHGGLEPRWSHSGREIFYRDGSGNLVSVAVSTSPTFSVGATTVLFPASAFAPNANHPQYDVSPDDKRFIFVRALSGNAGDKIIFVDNWFQELKARANK